MASVRLPSLYASAAVTRFQPFSIPKAKLPPSFALVLPRGRLYVPTRQDHGTTCMSGSKSKESTIKKRNRLTARPRIGRKGTSAGYAALKSASTITLLALISSAMRRSRHGGEENPPARKAIKWGGLKKKAPARGGGGGLGLSKSRKFSREHPPLGESRVPG